MVCGWVEACINPLAVAGFCRARALTTKFNEKPEKASRFFEEKRYSLFIFFMFAKQCLMSQAV